MDQVGKLDLSVLYVEDDDATREETALFLGRRIRNLMVASNGREGLERFRANPVDLVVTDIRMPIMDGLKMAEAMRSEQSNLQIIVATAHSELQNLMQAIDIGIDQYVLKPIDTDKLQAALMKCARVINTQREREIYLSERERLISDLQKALSEIKKLQGFLPICSSCKKIRDDQGYWNILESYIQDHSEAVFSHSMCPDCSDKFYGHEDWYISMKVKKEMK